MRLSVLLDVSKYLCEIVCLPVSIGSRAEAQRQRTSNSSGSLRLAGKQRNISFLRCVDNH